jgi:hypothetical protein
MYNESECKKISFSKWIPQERMEPGFKHIWPEITACFLSGPSSMLAEKSVTTADIKNI